jgi:1-deoxy-D-xylulose-5-phosphate reductoisomerase
MTSAAPKQRLRVAVMGSTGSIGVNTLDVIARHPDRFEVFALTGHKKVADMLAQVIAHRPRFVVMADEAAGAQLKQEIEQKGLVVAVLVGSNAMNTVASHPDVDAVMAAVVGAAGLPSTLAAARAGKRVLLANKEALVVGGELFMQAVRDGGATLLPIDSEHSAIFQSLPDDPSTWGSRLEKIILTGSGGPFRTRDVNTLQSVTPEEAVAHPNWVMGQKISVDSATMMNKALEVIEAKFLFGVAPEQLEVVIHPQSVIHSMVQYPDSSVVAQLGTPDMRTPIAYGLSWPQRIESGAARLDFAQLKAMTFEPPDPQRFPGLGLAWQVLRAAAGTPAVLNAANEVAVDAFLKRRIRFTDIHTVNAETLGRVLPSQLGGLGDLLALDEQARQTASACVERLAV